MRLSSIPLRMRPDRDWTLTLSPLLSSTCDSSPRPSARQLASSLVPSPLDLPSPVHNRCSAASSPLLSLGASCHRAHHASARRTVCRCRRTTNGSLALVAPPLGLPLATRARLWSGAPSMVRQRYVTTRAAARTSKLWLQTALHRPTHRQLGSAAPVPGRHRLIQSSLSRSRGCGHRRSRARASLLRHAQWSSASRPRSLAAEAALSTAAESSQRSARSPSRPVTRCTSAPATATARLSSPAQSISHGTFGESRRRVSPETGWLTLALACALPD